MERKKFIKTTGLVFGGLTFGFSKASSLFLPTTIKLYKPVTEYKALEEPIEPASPFFWGWLARLVVSSLVTSLVAKVVDKLVDEPVCTGESCKIKNANYTTADGIYGYNNINSRFYTQNINDPSVQFQNQSVPFIYQREQSCGAPYLEITKIQGPYLVGLCKMSSHLLQSNDINSVRHFIAPTESLKNSGYRFDSRDCNQESITSFKTQYGKTVLDYDLDNSIIYTRVYDKVNNLQYSNDFNVYQA